MTLQEFKEAMQLLAHMPLLWVPGVVGGIIGAVLWISFNLAGTFFTGRFLVIAGLLLIFFITGLITMVKSNSGDVRTMVSGGVHYYFRVLLPQLVIIFGIVLIFALLMVTMTFAGVSEAADVNFMILLAIVIMIPTLLLTFFFDMAAVYEDRKVFDSIKRSIALVATHTGEVIAYILVSISVIFGITLGLMIVWEAILYDNLEPITQYNVTQIQSFTPGQLVAMIGPGGMWVTAVIIFFGVALLIPILYTYKACFFKKLVSTPISLQQMTSGEYDSKGRWYKY
jgi:hypothetical protein